MIDKFIIFLLFSICFFNQNLFAQEIFSNNKNLIVKKNLDGFIDIHKITDTHAWDSFGYSDAIIETGDFIEFELDYYHVFVSKVGLRFGLSNINKKEPEDKIDYRIELTNYGRDVKLYHGDIKEPSLQISSEGKFKIFLEKYEMVYFLNNEEILRLPRNVNDSYRIHFNLYEKYAQIQNLNIVKAYKYVDTEPEQFLHETPFAETNTRFRKNEDNSVDVVKKNNLKNNIWNSYGFGSSELVTGNSIEFEFVYNDKYTTQYSGIQCGLSSVKKSNPNSMIDYWVDLNNYGKMVNYFFNNNKTANKELIVEASGESKGRFKIEIQQSQIVFYNNGEIVMKSPREANTNYKFHYRLYDSYAAIKNLKINKSPQSYWGF